MEKAIKLLQLVGKSNFLDVFIVAKNPRENVYTIESIAFLTREEAQQQCDYLNKKHKTKKYRVFKTCAYV